MREIDVRLIEDKIAELCVEANHYLSSDLKACMTKMLDEEDWPVAREMLKSIQKNIEIA